MAYDKIHALELATETYFEAMFLNCQNEIDITRIGCDRTWRVEELNYWIELAACDNYAVRIGTNQSDRCDNNHQNSGRDHGYSAMP